MATYKMLCTSDLREIQPYHRNVSSKWVNKIANGFDPILLKPLFVNERDGKYVLVDGRHRLAALEKMNGGNPCTVFCYIVKGLSLEEEAKYYLLFNNQKW